jgi:hypothetical protein
MRLLLRAAFAALVVALVTAAPSGAILGGKPDTAHRYVGILVTVIDGKRVPVCSGFLVSPTVFVTAGHCVNALGGTLPAYVSFDQSFRNSSPLVSGTAVPNPDFNPASSAHEIALVVLASPVTDRGVAQLPTPDLLDTAARGTPLTIVGYGANGFLKGGGRPPDFQLVRSYADARLVKVEAAKKGLNLRMSSGICFGDSGGPVLLGSSDVAVGINSFVKNAQCAGNSFAFRLDTAESLGFLAPYL